MTIDKDHDNYYRVDYNYASYNKAVDCWYEDLYISKPFATESEARAYADRVIQRANARPDIELDNLTIIYIDQQYWDEHGDVQTVERFEF